jgi:DNA-binding response OmpR family regulator
MPPVPVVLIVENDLATHELYARTLQAEYEVVVAADAKEAQAVLDAQTVQAIVLEPGPIGNPNWTLVTDLKQCSGLSTIPLILCTAQDERRHGLALGAAAYLTKPVLPATLLETIHTLLILLAHKEKDDE